MDGKAGRHKKTDPNRKKDLTPDEVRSFPLFAHFTDEQAGEVIETLKRFCEIICYIYKRKLEKSENDFENT